MAHQIRETHQATLLQHVLIGLIRLYRLLLSPLLGPHCRFHPSCSCYALTAIRTHGAGKGTWLALKRITRCHPYSAGGHDPVPPVALDRNPQ